VPFLTCVSCLSSVPSKLRFRAIWILENAVTYSYTECKVAHFEDLVLDFSLTHLDLVPQPYILSVLGSLMLSPISLSLKTEVVTEHAHVACVPV
jgi:hypothetical protein